jgi:predicted DsbA family dithiol-disulfide isomerase
VNDINLPICTDDTWTTAPVDPTRVPKSGSGVIQLDVVSDVICPWCFMGKRRLEKAIKLLGDSVDVRVTWKPFQLNPWMPKEGIDRQEYRRAKFGSMERSQQLDARLVAVGASEGIEFHLDRITRTPNTLDAHRLIWLAQQHGLQDAVVEALFQAYFVDGIDIGDQTNLMTVAESVGMNRTLVEKLLSTDLGVQEVLAEESKFKALGIEGVPSFVVQGTVLFSGAAEPQVIGGVGAGGERLSRSVKESTPIEGFIMPKFTDRQTAGAKSAQVVAEESGTVVIRITGRQYPAVALEGDTLLSWKMLLDAVAKRADTLSDTELLTLLQPLRNRVDAVVTDYNRVCKAHKLGGFDL